VAKLIGWVDKKELADINAAGYQVDEGNGRAVEGQFYVQVYVDADLADLLRPKGITIPADPKPKVVIECTWDGPHVVSAPDWIEVEFFNCD
jgi:hypothetical protein